VTTNVRRFGDAPAVCVFVRVVDLTLDAKSARVRV
jgi:hypothetical protein